MTLLFRYFSSVFRIILFLFLTIFGFTLHSQTFTIPASGSNSITTCSGMLYDAAGTGSYGNGWNGYTVIYPATAGSMVRISGTTSGESCCDYVQVYQGVGLTTLVGQYQMGTAIPTITSNQANGALTVRFYSDGSVVGAGPVISLTCITNAPSAPTLISSSVSSICTPGTSATLTAQGAVGTVYWYTGGCGTTLIGTGNPIVVTPGATTVYYASNYNGGLFSSTCASYTLNVSGNPAPPTASNVTVGCGTTATLNASGGGGTSYAWYTNSNATGQVGSGTPFVTPAVTTNTTYYVSSATLVPGSQTFNYTGSQQTWTVPTGVTSINVDVQGAQGGTSSYGTGGNGGRVQATIPVTPGQTVYVNVGGQGTMSVGGWNGGGAPYSSGLSGGGGGASDIRIGGIALTDRKIVAGGGGGAGYCYYYCSGDHGGAGGTLTGGPGLSGSSNIPSYGGQGGTQAAGGAGATTGGAAGTLGNGGGSGYYAGGGGGGYYGGGAGYYGGGGGGGSNFAMAQATGVTQTQGFKTGDGIITFSWNGIGCVSSTVPVIVNVNAITAPTASGVTIACGQTASLTASNNLGSINWYSNAAGSTLLGSGNNFTTPVLSSTTTYYIGAGTGSCATAINSVTVTVTPLATPVAANQSINCGGTATLTASNSTGTYVWYSDAACTQQIGTGASYTTPALLSSTTYYVRTQSGVAGCNMNTLTNILNNLNATQGTISAAVTNGYNFTMDGGLGVNDNYIFDGGGDMYDGGNYISTNFAANIYYSDGVILNSNSFGTGGQYFTKKITNMWVLAANVNNVSSFSISGNNGADGGGAYDGTTFNVTVGCQTYKVMLKRVYSAGDPSINQMVIIPDLATATHTWATNTDNTQHDITGLAGTTRMYYLLYAGNSGAFLDNATATNIATTFLTQVSAATASVPVCQSNATAVTVTVNSNIVQPVVSGNTTIGCGNTTTLTSSAGNNTAWYDAATNGNLLGIGTNYVTPSLTSGSTIYAVQATVTAGTQTFNYTGSQQTWTVPAGVNSINVDVQGAQGGTSSYGSGGNGGRIQATIPVTPGQVLNINVGGQGTISAAGWNGGGAPYGCGCVGGGGGASDIRIGGTALTDRKIVAGGGGGAGYYWNWMNDPGGLGGGVIGGGGYTNGALNPTYCGQGGTQSAGGAGATSGGPAGTLGTGGANGYYAGSGGGGYYGGGAGYGGGGGGGGSSYSINTATNVVHSQGFKTGNGLITISWNAVGCASTPVAVPITVNALAAPTSSNVVVGCGTTANLTASNGAGTTYTWYTNANGTGAVASGANFTTPALTTATTYYVSAVSTSPGTQTFNYTGSQQTWTVPAGVTSVTVDARGAQGGTSSYGTGGNGGRIQATLPVTPGQTLYINVGGQGSMSAAGWNGGGAPYSSGITGGGGGATDIRIGGTALTDRKIVAGGGGGGGYYYNWTLDHGGPGGGLTGGAGYTNGALNPSYCGQGGTQSAGGAGATTGGPAGTLGVGGGSAVYGGGGGGGYYGGGAGYYGGGGGGGSNFSDATATGVTHTQGYTTGNGLLVLSWNSAVCVSSTTPVSITVNALTAPTASNSTINCGQTATLTASNNLGGIIWYTTAAGSTQLGTGASYTTPQLSTTTTYYVGAGTGACATAINPVTVTVNALVNPTVNASVSINCGQTAALSASGGGGASYTWYSNAAASNQVGTGANWTTPSLTNTTTYYVTSNTGSAAGTTYSFTNCGSTGQFGPTQAQVNAAYTATNLSGSVTSSSGIQLWTVPTSGTYRIEAFGAQGGGNNQFGRGAQIRGDFALTAGQQLKIIVGQQGGLYGTGSGSGGGGSFVATSANVPLIVAGGGGGQYDGTSALYNAHAVTANNGQPTGCTTGGTGGNGGNGCTSSGAAGGGGFNTNGTNGTYGTGGLAFVNGGTGGNHGSNAVCVGGFGGGGGTHGNTGGGGAGGGYSGGAGGFHNTSTGSGGGGGSYNNGTNQSNVGGVRTGHGLVTITSLTTPCASNAVPVTVTVNALTAPAAVANAATVNCGQTSVINASGGNTYTWYSNAAATTQVGTGSTFTTPSLSNTTTYYVTSSSGLAAGTAYNFSNAAATGRSGPTQVQINAAYAGSNLANAVTINTQGIQEWIVPQTGQYRILANGAQGGGTGGLGARMQGDFNLTQGQKLFIVVGQQGLGAVDGNACGGGGGSFVATGSATYTTATALIVAGGGGGGSPQQGQPGLTTTNGGQGESCQLGGTNGNGGADASGCGSGAGGAGGFLTDGASGGSWGTQRGYGFISGAAMGGTSSSGAREGGFGGGAGTHSNNTGGGAGGGYSGGSAPYHGTNYEGGGGGSFNNGTNQVNTQGIQSGNGSVVITPLTSPCVSPVTPVTVTVNAIAAPVVSGTTNLCVNGSGNTTLTASGSPSGYTWYANANGTGQLSTNAAFTTPNLNTTTTYYVQSTTPQGGSQTFNYTGGVQTFTAPVTGTYTLEVWGAQGGGGINCYGAGGAGGYSKGNVSLTAGQTIYVAVGQQGFKSSSSTAYNGGGAGNPNGADPGYTGGGATHIATANGALASLSANQNAVLLVAGGGGGAAGGTCVCSYQGNGGAGGGTSGITGICSGNDCGYRPAGTGGTQVAGGTSQTPAIAAGFGLGATASTLTNDCIQGGGGGGGWYGGGAGGQAGGGGGGGSGYVSNLLTVTQVLAGNVSMPNPSGGVMTGRLGNGIAVITWSGTGCVSSVTPVTVSVGIAPATNAGPSVVDASTCGKNTVNLGANALAAGQSGTWTLLSGTNANGIFSLPTAASTQFTGTYGGSYVLQWAVTNQSNGCVANDTLIVTFNQPSDAVINGLIGQGDLLWCGLTGTDWSTSTNWYLKQATSGLYPNGYYQRMSGVVQPAINNEVFTVSVANGGMCIGNNTPTLSINSNAEDVYVGPGITWNLSNDSINIAQNLVNNGTIIASTGITNFTGSSNSIISGSGNTQLFNMRVNKSAGATLTLQQPVLVTNNLNMVQGNVFTTSTNLLTLGTSSAAPGSLTYNTGTIVGPFKRYFANVASTGTAGLFPVGTAVYNRYADFSFGSGPGVDQFLTVEYKPGAPMQGGIPLYNGLPLMASGSMIQNYSADGYWSVIPTNNNYTAPITSVNYGVTLFANNLTGMQSPQVCRIIKSAGSNTAAQHHVAWQACGTHTPINGAANPQSFLITSTATQGFSWFNIGTPNSQALPVELLSFNGDCNEGQVNLSWQTATEHNSDYFELEKSRDGMNWQMLTTVNAAGNSTQLLNYEATDAEAMEGNNYYRLTQVDIDGTTKTYDVINVSCSGAAKGYFSAYPNPSTGSFQVILNDKNLVGSGILSVKDTKGAELLNRTIEVKPGINMFSVTDLNLAPGVYYIQIVNGERATEVLKEVIR